MPIKKYSLLEMFWLFFEYHIDHSWSDLAFLTETQFYKKKCDILQLLGSEPLTLKMFYFSPP